MAAHLRGQRRSRTGLPKTALVTDAQPPGNFAPQIQQPDDAFVAAHKMVGAVSGGVFSFAKRIQSPIGKFRVAGLPIWLPLSAWKFAAMLQDSEHRRLAAFTRPDFQQPAFRAATATVQPPFVTRRAVEERRRVGIAFRGM